jgi:hypothetical protein
MKTLIWLAGAFASIAVFGFGGGMILAHCLDDGGSEYWLILALPLAVLGAGGELYCVYRSVRDL